MENEFGIKESLELVSGIELLAVGGIKVVKSESAPEKFMAVVEIAKHGEALVEAFKGLEVVGKELKDLNQEELVELGLKAFNMVKHIAEELKK